MIHERMRDSVLACKSAKHLGKSEQRLTKRLCGVQISREPYGPIRGSPQSRDADVTCCDVTHRSCQG